MKKIVLLLLILLGTQQAKAEEGVWELEFRAGVNLGGAAPFGVPVEIREIISYNPAFNAFVEGAATFWQQRGPSHGITFGIRVEELGMKSRARVKNYHTSVINGGVAINGYYTGEVETNYGSTHVTLPVLYTYRFSRDWRVRAGLFTSFRVDGNFNGVVTNGYLRQGSPVGEKISFPPGSEGPYNFTDELDLFNWGLQIGGSWRAYRSFTINADFTMGFRDIMRPKFEGISFGMYPMFLKMGFGYLF